MSERTRAATNSGTDSCVEWIPLLLGTGLVLLWTPGLPRWGDMWLLAGVIFAGFKWLTCSRAVSEGVATNRSRIPEYLLLWPGMDARTFLDVRVPARPPTKREHAAAVGKMCMGALLVWGVARLAGGGLTSGWIAMVGAILMVHCGCFHLLSIFWRTRGVNAKPLMRMPVAAASVSEFWGRRWNVAFQEIAFGAFFQPLCRRFGAGWALMGTFFVSGVIHDVVISIPARGGYGLPTLYFSLQGAALIFEHRNRWWFRRNRMVNRLFAWLVVAGPAGVLFPPVFVERVMLPFLEVIGAL